MTVCNMIHFYMAVSSQVWFCSFNLSIVSFFRTFRLCNDVVVLTGPVADLLAVPGQQFHVH